MFLSTATTCTTRVGLRKTSSFATWLLTKSLSPKAGTGWRWDRCIRRCWTWRSNWTGTRIFRRQLKMSQTWRPNRIGGKVEWKLWCFFIHFGWCTTSLVTWRQRRWRSSWWRRCSRGRSAKIPFSSRMLRCRRIRIGWIVTRKVSWSRYWTTGARLRTIDSQNVCSGKCETLFYPLHLAWTWFRFGFFPRITRTVSVQNSTK